MQKDTEKSQDTLYQDRLRRSKLILDLQRRGIWEQIHGTVLHPENTQSNRQNINE